MKIVALTGGVGGAKLVHGLSHHLPPDHLTVIVNTGDDFEHLGLSISPDLDTVCYTLAGLANPVTGWGQIEETYNMLSSLGILGGETWFRLGDLDLATHLERTKRLRGGQSLSQITQDFCLAWGVTHKILPMSNDPVHTFVATVEYGELLFQDYFVRRHYKPKIIGFRMDGIESARPSPGILEAIRMADAIIICPSNPFVSIDPIIMVPGIRSGLSQKVIVAVSPIIDCKVVKGPLAKMYHELGIDPSADAVAKHYHELLAGYICDNADERDFRDSSIPVLATNIMMKTHNDRKRLAKNVLNFIQTL